MENLNIREDVSDIVNKTELLADLQIGFWIIEYPNDGIPKMYGDTIMYSLLGGNSNTLTPEELYSFCMERIVFIITFTLTPVMPMDKEIQTMVRV